MGGTLHCRPVLAAAARAGLTRAPSAPAVLRSRSARLHLAPAAVPVPAPVDVDPPAVLPSADAEPRRFLGEEELDRVPDDRPQRAVERFVEVGPARAEPDGPGSRLEHEVPKRLAQKRGESIGG